MRFAVCAAICGAALLAQTDARADEALRLTWFAPAGCPSAEEVKAAALRGIDPASVNGPGKVPLEADAHVEQQTPSSWRVFLKTRRGTTVGEREIEAASCAGVADATAVILALALVPPGSAPVTPPPPPAPPPPAPTAPPAQPAPSPEPGSHHFALGVSLVTDFGAMPKPAVGGAAHIAWRPSRFWGEAFGRFLGGQTASVGDTNVGASFSILGAGARACFTVVQVSIVDASPCVGAGVDVVSAQGKNADNNLQPTKAWVNLGYGAVARVEVTKWLAMRARVEATSPLYRPTFVVEGTGHVHRPSSIGAGAYFGAEVLFL